MDTNGWIRVPIVGIPYIFTVQHGSHTGTTRIGPIVLAVARLGRVQLINGTSSCAHWQNLNNRVPSSMQLFTMLIMHRVNVPTHSFCFCQRFLCTPSLRTIMSPSIDTAAVPVVVTSSQHRQPSSLSRAMCVHVFIKCVSSTQAWRYHCHYVVLCHQSAIYHRVCCCHTRVSPHSTVRAAFVIMSSRPWYGREFMMNTINING